MKKRPKETTGIIQIDSTGKFYSVCWGLQRTKKPTSELCTHILCLAVKAEKQYGVDRVVYHCHSQNLIALTFILPLKSEIITKELWQMMTECPIIFPEGVGVVEWMIPGGPAIAKVTSCLMNSYNAVIWAHHGTFCIEDSFDSAFGLMHTLEKSAEIWIKVHSCSDRKRQTITKENFIKLAKNFGVSLNESALKECA
jgi:rhamnulose-1-phosphate aldolase